MTKGLLLLLLMIHISGYAQDQPEPIANEPEPIVKKNNHYVGIQANELLRQLFNFGGSTPAIVNPYLIIYSINSTRTGVGWNMGLGYNYNQFSSGDAITPRESTISNFAWRMGIEKKFSLGKRWYASAGGDVLVENSKDKTETSFNQGQGVPPFVTNTESTLKSVGIGPRVTLNFNISDKIVLGTEASYYYKSSESTQKATNQPTANSSPKSFTFAVPAVLFLILKF